MNKGNVKREKVRAKQERLEQEIEKERISLARAYREVLGEDGKRNAAQEKVCKHLELFSGINCRSIHVLPNGDVSEKHTLINEGKRLVRGGKDVLLLCERRDHGGPEVEGGVRGRGGRGPSPHGRLDGRLARHADRSDLPHERGNLGSARPEPMRCERR